MQKGWNTIILSHVVSGGQDHQHTWTHAIDNDADSTITSVLRSHSIPWVSVRCVGFNFMFCKNLTNHLICMCEYEMITSQPRTYLVTALLLGSQWISGRAIVKHW